MDTIPGDGNGARKNYWDRLPPWGKWTVGLVAVLILLIIGAGIGEAGNKEESLKSEITVLKSERDQAREDQRQAEREADLVKRREARIIQRAEGRANRIVSKTKTENERLEASLASGGEELESLEGRVGSAQGELENIREAIGGAREERAMSSITDGTWRAEVDYIPGTYEAPGGGSCYWALLSEPGGSGIEGIIENGGFNKHQILNITSPYFETRGCGTWHRVG